MKKPKAVLTEKALREHVDEDGNSLDVYKSSQTQSVDKMSIKFN